MINKIKSSLTIQVFIAMAVGILSGLLAPSVMIKFGFIGSMWLNGIKMLIIPMILTTLVVGIVSQKDLGSLGRIAFHIMAYYVSTTVFAAAVGIVTAKVLKPGMIANLTNMSAKEVSGDASITIAGFFTGLISDNMFASFSSGNIIQSLIIAIMMGVAVLMIPDEMTKNKLISMFESLEKLINSMIGIVMKLSPIGIFFLMADSFGKYGTDIFSGIGALLGTFYVGCLAQIFVVYGLFLLVGAGISPLKFIKDSIELWVYTISTCSSVAAIPTNMKVAREKFGVDDKISGFTIPLGSQMNSDGSVILYSCVILFIAQMNGIDMGIGQLLKIILLGTVFSLGGSGIPGSNIVKVLVLVEAFGLPTEIVGIVAAFYRLFDMGTTTNNCMGDLAGTILVSRLEERHTNKINAYAKNI